MKDHHHEQAPPYIIRRREAIFCSVCFQCSPRDCSVARVSLSGRMVRRFFCRVSVCVLVTIAATNVARDALNRCASHMIVIFSLLLVFYRIFVIRLLLLCLC